MKLDRCIACELPVLELEGQFAKLDSFYVRQGKPPLESAGYWHVRCLRESQFGSAWHDALLGNFCSVRGYERVADLAQWTIIRHPRSSASLAIGRTGEMFGIPVTKTGASQADGGVIVPRVEPEFHLGLDDVEVVRQIQDGLRTSGTYPIMKLLEAIGIADRMVHRDALTGAAFHFERHLQEFWSPNAVAARCEYGVFVPTELEPYIKKH